MNSKHIMIVEDEEKVASLLSDYLQEAGYQTSTQGNGDKAVEQIKKNPPDLILLDIVLPGKDGMEICREVRQFSTVPIMMITARVDEIDRIIGFELGADDYICKPFSFRELVARVKAVFKRTNSGTINQSLVAGPISIDNENHQVIIDKKSLTLTPNEFALLNIMVRQPNKVFSRSELISKIHGCDFEGYDRTVDVHIKNLRKKLSVKLPGHEIICTVYGVGYKLMIDPSLKNCIRG